jgi:spore maturation protein SpmB
MDETKVENTGILKKIGKDLGRLISINSLVEGCRQGFTIGTTATLPNVVMAFILIQFLNVSGLLTLIENVFQAPMGLLGLPGAAAAVLAGAFMSMGGGVGVAVGLLTSGALNAHDIVILMPAIFLMGGLMQFAGRILGTAEVPNKYFGVCFAICFINAILSMIIMRVLTTIL